MAASSDKNAREAAQTREATRLLGIAIRSHQVATGAGTAADRALWAVLAEVMVPFGDGDRSVGDMLSKGNWTDDWHIL